MAISEIAQNLTLTAQNVSCIRGDRAVFARLSFICRSGVPLVVRGANGAGKSTLLRLVAGLIRPSAGHFQWQDGEDRPTPDPDQFHYVGHQEGLKPAFSIRQNLDFWVRYMGGPNPSRSDDALDKWQIRSIAAIPAQFLSAGQRKRTTLARLLLVDRPIWLLDEPTVSLDAAGRAILQDVMVAHAARGGTIMVATHDEMTLPRGQVLDLSQATEPVS